MADRPERWEWQSRRWKWIGMAFAVPIGSRVLLAFVGLLVSDGSHEARRLLVRDEHGRVRMDMGTDPDGTPRRRFFGEGGRGRLVAHLAEGDVPRPSFSGKEGRTRLLPGTDGPWLDSVGDDGRGRLAVTVNPNGFDRGLM
jgi:hypothetical protein